MILGWLCISTMYLISKLITDHTTVPTMLFFRCIVALACVLPWILARGIKSLKITNPNIVIFRAVLATLNLCFVFLAINQISLINATLLSNSAPFFLPFIVWIWRGIPIDHKHWPAIIVGFIGMALILNPDKRILNLGAFYGLLSGITMAMSLLLMRLASKSENFISFMLYFCGIGGLLTLPFAIFNWKIDDWQTLLGLIAIGIFTTLGQMATFHAVKYAEARQLSPFMYSSVIFSGIYEWLIWNQSPHLLGYLGIILIFAGGAWIVYVSRVPKR